MTGRCEPVVRETDRVERGNAYRGNVQRQGQTARRRNGDPNSREIARACPRANPAEVAPTGAAFGQHLFKQRHQPFRLPTSHVLGTYTQNPVAGQQSGRAMRGRCVEPQNELVRSQRVAPR